MPRELPSRRPLPKGLYLITPDEPDCTGLLARVASVLPFASCLQYRNKRADASLREQQALALRALCRSAGVPLIINDDAALAATVRADGVHIGEHDGDIPAARALLGDGAIIGVSCYDELDRAEIAARAGADYIAFGAFFPSPTKPNARRAEPALLQAAVRLGVQQVAIGGITPDNARPLIAAGADLVAVISGVFDAADPVSAAQAYRACFTHPNLDSPAQAGKAAQEPSP